MLKQISKEELDNFSSQLKYSQFLQSSFWGDLQESMGSGVWRYAVIDDNNLDNILGACLIIKKRLPFGFAYLYAPRGPLLRDNLKEEDKMEITRLLFKSFRDISVKELKTRMVFFRFEPSYSPSGMTHIQKRKDHQPAKTLFLNLSKAESELLSDMHEKTRYNIGLAKRRGIFIIKTNKEKEYIDEFLNLMKKTSKRDGFRSHDSSYYEKMLKSSDKNIDLWIAKKDDKVLCANIVINFGDTVTYLHGASSDQEKNLMAPHLLQWSQILWAKENNYKYYDFWGISKDNNINNKWYGFTRFKKGFGGFEIVYPGTFDMVYDKRFYTLYNLIKRFI